MTPASRVGPDAPNVLLDSAGLRSTVERLGRELGERHHDDVVLVSVLKGAMIFTSDLARAVPFHPLIDFMAVSAYESGRRVRILKDLSLDITDADVILVADIVDTGLSLQYVLGELRRREPRSLSVCALVDKPRRRLLPTEIHHVGIEVEEDFLIGYGLDFAGRYRNLDVLAVGDLERLRADPDCYRAWAYGIAGRGSEDGSTSG